eukprot:CAMPEP_0206262578 /NCGR_PEP_ID=MMETSP0047_2-20121206/28317_1 /ASSEMBLY_ACC=CAM_ASM_000192 /TAXON_ID=195065 /ORGANISM="Chroomonas mesostigmatica_cf, Strain CCMP1168" /LENGTH=48 /DNA_ID= /DNA_START= /DNA_END= /DNA_ORIENTATION=
MAIHHTDQMQQRQLMVHVTRQEPAAHKHKDRAPSPVLARSVQVTKPRH